MDRAKIVIVGAGLAGLAAARRLITSGFKNVRVFEAKNRIGGRILTQKHGESFIEIGAQWIHGEGSNPVYQIAVENGLLQKESSEDGRKEEDLFYTQHGQLIPSEVAEDATSTLLNILEDANKFSRENVSSAEWNDSVGLYARQKFFSLLPESTRSSSVRQLKEAIFNWKMVLEKTENACRSADELSLHSWGQYLEFEGDESVVLKFGYEAVLQVILADIPAECIELAKEVKSIDWSGLADQTNAAPLKITMQNGETEMADYVIFTCSLGVLKSQATTMFKPALPEDKLTVIDRLGFGTVNKIFLEYEKPFWDKDCAAIELVWVQDEQPFFLNCLDNKHVEKYGEWYKMIHGFNVVENHSNLLCGWIAGTEAELIEQIDDDVIIDVCHELLLRFTCIEEMTRPHKMIRSCWNSDPHVRGSYTYVKAGYTAADCDALAQPLPSVQNPRLLFAGEATSKAYFSTTHGALLSGQREADHIVEVHGGVGQE